MGCDCDGGCLFNLDEDPEERTNLLDVYPDKTREMRDIMAQLRKPENGYKEPQLIKTDEYWAYCSQKSTELGYWTPVLPRDCYQKSSKGKDLAPGEWTGTGGTDLETCKHNAKIAGADYFAWTGEVYQPGYCKLLNKLDKSPNLKTNQGYGYELYENICRQEFGRNPMRVPILHLVNGMELKGPTGYNAKQEQRRQEVFILLGRLKSTNLDTVKY